MLVVFRHEELYNVGLQYGDEHFTEEWSANFWKELLQSATKTLSSSLTSKVSRAQV